MNYTIEIHEHGILIYGTLPLSHLRGLLKAFRKIHKVDLIDCLGIAPKYGANICLVNEKSHNLWLNELAIKKGGLSHEEKKNQKQNA